MDNTPKSTADILYEAIQLTRPLLRHITAGVDAMSRDVGVSVGQRAVLEVMMPDRRLTGPQLTEILQLKRQFVARMLSEAKFLELVQTEPNPAHVRAHFFKLTEKGFKAISQIRAREMVLVQEFADQFTEAEIASHHRIQLGLTSWFAELGEQKKGAEPCG